jgi:hypothetical protein
MFLLLHQMRNNIHYHTETPKICTSFQTNEQKWHSVFNITSKTTLNLWCYSQRDKRFLFIKYPDQLKGPNSFLLNGYQGSFHWATETKLWNYWLNPIYYSKLRMSGAVIHFNICLNSMLGDNITSTFRDMKESSIQTVFYIIWYFVSCVPVPRH